jgi:hypothetical protein
MILHAGDFTGPDVYDFLSSLAGGNVFAVCGNMDPPELAKVLPAKRIIDAAEVKIGLIHGWGAPHDLEERIERSFAGDDLDCLVYGHSHNPANHRRHGMLFFNPGSANASIGYLHISGKEVRGEIVRLPGRPAGPPR